MKISNITESLIGLFIMGLSIYLCLNLPNRNPSSAIISMFMVGLVGSFAPYIRLSQREGVKSFFKANGIFFHYLAGSALTLGVFGTFLSGSGIGLLIGLMAAALTYSIGSGLKSV